MYPKKIYLPLLDIHESTVHKSILILSLPVVICILYLFDS